MGVGEPSSTTSSSAGGGSHASSAARQRSRSSRTSAVRASTGTMAEKRGGEDIGASVPVCRRPPRPARPPTHHRRLVCPTCSLFGSFERNVIESARSSKAAPSMSP